MVHTDEIRTGSHYLVRLQDARERSVLFYTLRRFNKSQRQGGPGRQKGEDRGIPVGVSRGTGGGACRADAGAYNGVSGSHIVRCGFRTDSGGLSGPCPGRLPGWSQSGVGDPPAPAEVLAGPRRFVGSG